MIWCATGDGVVKRRWQWKIRAIDQPQDRQGAWPNCAPNADRSLNNYHFGAMHLYLCHIPAFVVALKLAPGAPLVAGLLGAFGTAA
jgi:hypothetical protein